MEASTPQESSMVPESPCELAVVSHRSSPDLNPKARAENVDSIHFVSLHDWAKCGVCGQVPKVPMSNCVNECILCSACIEAVTDKLGDKVRPMCPVRFCRKGFRKGQTRSNLGVGRAIQSLTVTCFNKVPSGGRLGCAWTGALFEVDGHLKNECKGHHLTCPSSQHGCAWTGVPAALQEHVTSCQNRVVVCNLGKTNDFKGCGQQMFVQNAGFHLEYICQYIACPNKIFARDGTLLLCPVMGYKRMVRLHIPHCQTLNQLMNENRSLTQALAASQSAHGTLRDQDNIKKSEISAAWKALQELTPTTATQSPSNATSTDATTNFKPNSLSEFKLGSIPLKRSRSEGSSEDDT